MSRRAGQYGDDNYGDTADETRQRPAPDAVLDAAEIREKLRANATAFKRLRSILSSGAHEGDPIAYEVRAPAGSRQLLKWGCIEIRNEDGRVLVWPLPFASIVMEGMRHG